jgi:hypothetical protein
MCGVTLKVFKRKGVNGRMRNLDMRFRFAEQIMRVKKLIILILLSSLMGCAYPKLLTTNEARTIRMPLTVHFVAPGDTPCEENYPGALGCYDGEVWIVSEKLRDGRLIPTMEILGHELRHMLNHRTRGLVAEPSEKFRDPWLPAIR